jgi:hypothetical protein
MQQSGKDFRTRAVRSRGDRPIKRNASVDFELLSVWLGLSLLQKKLSGSCSQPAVGRAARRPDLDDAAK